MKGVLLWRNRHCALSAEFETGRIFEATLGTDERQRVGTLAAKLHPLRIFEGALRAAHGFRCSFSGTKIVEQRLRILQVGGVEALGEPAVDPGEHHGSAGKPR
jgi:hypothetical protein